MEPLRSLSQVALLALAACASPRSAWTVQRVADDFHQDASARAVAVGADGGVFAVWQRGPSTVPLDLVRYDASGNVAWTAHVDDKRCGALPSFAPRAGVLPSGQIVVAAAMGIGNEPCVVAFTAAGQVAWATPVPSVKGVPHLAIAGDRVVVAGHTPDAHVVSLDGTGKIVGDMVSGGYLEDLAGDPEGHVYTIGHAQEAATGEWYAMAMAFDARGETVWGDPGAHGHPDLPMYVAAGGGLVVEGFRPGPGTLRLMEAGQGKWTRDIVAHGVAMLVGGPAGVAVAYENDDNWVIQVVHADGTLGPAMPLTVDPADEEGGASMGFLVVDGLAVTATSVVVGGESHNRLHLGSASTLTGRCKRVHQRETHGEPPRDYDDCQTFGFLARLPRQ